MNKVLLGLFVMLLGACAPQPPAATHLVPLAHLTGGYENGVFTISVVDGQDRAVQAATDSQLNTMSSGTLGATEPTQNYVLLHQTATRSLDTACNSAPYGESGVPDPFQGVCVTIRAVNGYDQYVLNEYVQLTSLTACGSTTSVTSYVKDASSTTIGVDNTYGLWLYGTAIRPYGDSMGRDRADRNWYFQTDNAGASACFRFSAVVMGELWSP